MLIYVAINFIAVINSEYRESSKWVKVAICAITFIIQLVMVIKRYPQYMALKRTTQQHRRSFCFRWLLI